MPLAIAEVRGGATVTIEFPRRFKVRTLCVFASVVAAHLSICALLLVQLMSGSQRQMDHGGEGGIELSLVGLTRHGVEPPAALASSSKSSAPVQPSLESLLGVTPAPIRPPPADHRAASNVFAELDDRVSRSALEKSGVDVSHASAGDAALGTEDPFAHPSLFAKASKPAAAGEFSCRAPPILREPVMLEVSLSSEGTITGLRRADGVSLYNRPGSLSEADIIQALSACRSSWPQTGAAGVRNVVLLPRTARR